MAAPAFLDEVECNETHVSADASIAKGFAGLQLGLNDVCEAGCGCVLLH